MAQRIFLSTAEYEVLWSHLDLGQMPYPIAVPTNGVTAVERAEVVERAWRSLGERRLADGREPDHDLALMLRALASPEISVDVVADVGGLSRALVVRGHDVAVLAMLDHEGLTLVRIRPTALAIAAADLLPDSPPGPGNAFTFPQEALRAAVAEEDDDLADDPFYGGGSEQDALVRAGMTIADARTLTELADRRIHSGQFGVRARDWLRGSGVSESRLVNWFDTDAGRYLVVRENDWISVTPAGVDRIAGRLDQVLAMLAGSR